VNGVIVATALDWILYLVIAARERGGECDEIFLCHRGDTISRVSAASISATSPRSYAESLMDLSMSCAAS